jgi:hypothetical protein
MANLNYTITPMFPKALMSADLTGVIGQEQIDFLSTLPMKQNIHNNISIDKYVLEYPVMSELKKAIDVCLEHYCREVMGLKKGQDLYITQSWTLINEPGITMHEHAHPNSIVSGSFYYDDIPTPTPNMVFLRANGYDAHRFNVDDDKINQYNTPFIEIEPSKNSLFLFSSNLYHNVQKNTTDKPRKAMAFNTYIKGTFGGESSMLTLG